MMRSPRGWVVACRDLVITQKSGQQQITSTFLYTEIIVLMSSLVLKLIANKLYSTARNRELLQSVPRRTAVRGVTMVAPGTK